MVACRHAVFPSVAFSFIWWIEKLTMCLLFADVTCSTENNQQRGYTELLEGTELLMFQILHIIKTLRPKQNGRHFADDIFKCIFLNGDIWIPNKISLKLVPKGPFDNIPSSVQIMAWRRPGDKSLSEPIVVILLTHICVTRPQWVLKHLPLSIQTSIKLSFILL